MRRRACKPRGEKGAGGSWQPTVMHLTVVCYCNRKSGRQLLLCHYCVWPTICRYIACGTQALRGRSDLWRAGVCTAQRQYPCYEYAYTYSTVLRPELSLPPFFDYPHAWEIGRSSRAGNLPETRIEDKLLH